MMESKETMATEWFKSLGDGYQLPKVLQRASLYIIRVVEEDINAKIAILIFAQSPSNVTQSGTEALCAGG